MRVRHVEEPTGERSLGELLGQLTTDVAQLVRKEVELARLEVRQEAKRAGRAGGLLGGAAVLGLLAAVMLSFALAWLLDRWMPAALAFAVVGAAWVVGAAVLYRHGRAELARIDPVPTETVETLKEDMAWARAQRS